MRTAKTVSITLPPDLLVKAQSYAEREHRTMSELFREAGCRVPHISNLRCGSVRAHRSKPTPNESAALRHSPP